MRCTCPEDWQGMDHTAGCKARARWSEVTPEEVKQIDKMLAPEFAKGDWQTVESETNL